jgi:hypothetical protein
VRRRFTGWSCGGGGGAGLFGLASSFFLLKPTADSHFALLMAVTCSLDIRERSLLENLRMNSFIFRLLALFTLGRLTSIATCMR